MHLKLKMFYPEPMNQSQLFRIPGSADVSTVSEGSFRGRGSPQRVASELSAYSSTVDNPRGSADIKGEDSIFRSSRAETASVSGASSFWSTRMNFIERLYPDMPDLYNIQTKSAVSDVSAERSRRRFSDSGGNSETKLSPTIASENRGFAVGSKENLLSEFNFVKEGKPSLWMTCKFDMPSAGSNPTLVRLFNPSCDTPLECLVKCMSGGLFKSRGRYSNVIWVDKSLKTICFNEEMKTRSIPVEDIVEVKSGGGQELKIKLLDQKVSFHFCTRQQCETFFMGICLLAPTETTVKYQGKEVQMRSSYNPLVDVYNEKPVYKKKRFGDYVLLKGIGHGAFGKVYLALHLKERIFYAVKAVKKRSHARRDFVLKAFGDSYQFKPGGTYERETEVMRLVDNHKNVVSLKEILEDPDRNRLLIICELMPNGALMSTENLRSMKPLNEMLAKKVFLDALTGLEYLHSQRIVHRDIKPDNLLTQPDGTVKLSDFGTSKVYRTEDRTGKDTAVGTPAFCAPEHCASLLAPTYNGPSYKSDIWSLGATLYFLLFGKLCFQEKTVFDTFDSICSQELKFYDTPKVSIEAKRLIESMMVKEPSRRASIEELKALPWLRNV